MTRTSPYVEKYRKYLEINKARFEELLSRIQNTNLVDEREIIARKAIKLACGTATGYYSSEVLEKVYTDIAEMHSIALPADFAPNSFLHVMTGALESGGHTRVVERWIAMSPGDQYHSVIFTGNATQSIPSALVDAVKEKNGTIQELRNNVSYIDNSLVLRAHAASYEYIIIHVNPEDPIPLIAFGTSEFKRPVIFFNHADHVFWLGISIADIVADLKTLGREITLKKRHARKSFMLGVPMPQKNTFIDKDKASIRKMLNLPQDKKIILSYGSQYKYRPLLDLNFYEYITRMTQYDDTLVIIIGREKKWYTELAEFERKHNDKLKGLYVMPHGQLLDYINAADLIVDSFPMPGITAIIDAVTAGIPVLSLRNLVGQQDYVMESPAYCQSMDELVEKSFKILGEQEYAKQNIEELSQRVQINLNSDAFIKKLNKLYEQTPKEHTMHSFKTESPLDFIECDAFTVHKSLRENLLLNIFPVIKVIERKLSGVKYKEFEIKILKKSFFIIYKKRF